MSANSTLTGLGNTENKDLSSKTDPANPKNEANSTLTASTQTEDKDKPSFWHIVILFLVVLILVELVALWVFRADLRPSMAMTAVAFGLVGVYPFTYVAYLSFREGVQRKRLEDDFRLLGLVKEEELKETVEKLYQTAYSRTQFWVYIGLIMVSTLLVLAGYINREGLGFTDARVMTLIFYSYLGAYVFSVQELIRRYNTFDLRPQVYSSILMRMLIATIITFVGASVIILGGGDLAPDASGPQAEALAWAAVLAFVIGSFPSRGIRWFTQRANTVLKSPADQNFELPLRNILGISIWHESRLIEMGIDDAQNLATVDIRKLLLTTQFDTQQIINWIDQSILYVKVGSKIERFRDAKITTFHELRVALIDLQLSLLQRSQNDQANKEASLEKFSATLGIADILELKRLSDFSNFPNYSHLAEYYLRTTFVARQRALIGMETLTGAIKETNYEEAIENAERLLRHNPHNSEVLVKLGVSYLYLGQKEKAYDAYTEALKLDKNLVPAYVGLSLIYIDRGDYEKAIQACTSAISLDRTHGQAFNNRGLAYSHLNYPDRAIEDLNEALELNDRYGVAYYNRGLVYNTQGKFALALGDFEKAYLLGHSDPNLWFVWGKALIGTGNYAEAISKLSQAVLYETNLVRAYTERGFAYLQLGELYYPQARSDLEMALKKDKTSVIAYNNLGLLEARLGNYRAAIANYKTALDLDQSQYVTRYNLAVAHHNLGEIEEARAQFQTLADSAPPGSFEVNEARTWLAHHNP